MAIRTIQPKYFPYFDYKRYAFSLGTEAESFVFTSGQSASTYDDQVKKVVCRGDLVQQARTVHDKLKLILENASSDFADIVQIVDYVSPEVNDTRSLLQVHHEYFGDILPPLTQVNVRRLLRPGALVETELMAIKGKEKGTELGKTTPSNSVANSVRKNDLICVAPQMSFDKTSNKFESSGDPRAQLAKIRENIELILSNLGGKFEDIVKVTEYVRSDYLNKTIGKEKGSESVLFRSGVPTSVVVVNKLTHPDALVEVEVLADVSEKKRIISFGGSNVADACSITGQGLVFLPLESANADNRNPKQSLSASESMTRILEKVKASAGSLNLDLGNIAKTRDFLTEEIEPQYRETAQIRRGFFKDQLPASSGVIIERVWPGSAALSMESVAVQG